MKAFELPTDHQEMVRWIEDRLVSTDLVTYVNELSVLREVVSRHEQNDSAASDSLHDVVGDVGNIQTHGLRSLSQEQLQRLLKNPTLLLDLQFEVLSGGTDYWRTKQDSIATVTHASSHKRPLSKPLIRFAALAACIAIVVGSLVWNSRRGANSVTTTPPIAVAATWGWLGDKEFQDDKEYLAWVESGASAWFDKQPGSKESLAQRLAELRMGCQQLIESDHAPLNASDAEFLRKRCIEWKKKFDRLAKELDSKESDFTEIHQRADQVVRNAIVVIQGMRNA